MFFKNVQKGRWKYLHSHLDGSTLMTNWPQVCWDEGFVALWKQMIVWFVFFRCDMSQSRWNEQKFRSWMSASFLSNVNIHLVKPRLQSRRVFQRCVVPVRTNPIIKSLPTINVSFKDYEIYSGVVFMNTSASARPQTFTRGRLSFSSSLSGLNMSLSRMWCQRIFIFESLYWLKFEQNNLHS